MEGKKSQSSLKSIEDWRSFDFNSITNLQSLFGKFKIESIENKCFQDFTCLKTLSFTNNYLGKNESN